MDMKLTKNQQIELRLLRNKVDNLEWVLVTLDIFKELLQKIPDRACHPDLFQFGICNAITTLASERLRASPLGTRDKHPFYVKGSPYSLVIILAMNWKHTLHPDNYNTYPVPSYGGSNWEGKDLEMRISLIKHCIAYLRQQRDLLRSKS